MDKDNVILCRFISDAAARTEEFAKYCADIQATGREVELSFSSEDEQEL